MGVRAKQPRILLVRLPMITPDSEGSALLVIVATNLTI